MIKSVWVAAYPVKDYDNLVDGPRLSQDTEKTINFLESDGYELVSITLVISGRYGWRKYDGRTTTQYFIKKPTISPDTAVSWGYSMTDGVMVVARNKNI